MGDQESLDHIRRIDNEIRTTDQQAYEQGQIVISYDGQLSEIQKKLQMLQVVGIISMLAIVGLGIIAASYVYFICSITILIFIVGLIVFLVLQKNYNDYIQMLTIRKSSLQSAVAGYMKKTADLKNALNLEISGRYEDAAQVYDYYSLFVDAGYARRVSRISYVEHSGKVMNIAVNLNHMLTQIREQGLAIPYKCPQCGGSITISGASSTESLVQCPFCNTMLYNVVDFLKSILH